MSRLFYHVMQDSSGNILTDVTGTIRHAGTGTLATIYGDEALTVIVANPMTNHPSFGSFKFYLAGGDYDFYMARAGYTFETLTGLQGHGTMAQQDAHAVAITGGTLEAISAAHIVRLGANTAADVLYALAVNGEVLQTGGGVRLERLALNTAPDALYRLAILGNMILTGRIGIGTVSRADIVWALQYNRAIDHGAMIIPSADTGAGNAMLFANAGGGAVGSITTTAAATSYNTSSDVRLKHAITPLTGALDVVRALNPVSHRWRADDSHGVGFLAHEVQQVVDGVTTGEKDAVDEAGQIVPQMIDYSKLVPWLVSACQELAQQVEMLTAQLAEAGA